MSICKLSGRGGREPEAPGVGGYAGVRVRKSVIMGRCMIESDLEKSLICMRVRLVKKNDVLIVEQKQEDFIILVVILRIVQYVIGKCWGTVIWMNLLRMKFEFLERFKDGYL